MNDNYEEITENKAFRKRLKVFYYVLYGLVAMLFLCGVMVPSCLKTKIATYIIIGLLVVCLIAIVLWLIIGGSKIRCPHCDRYIGRSDPWNIRKCPYCGDSLEIVEYIGRDKIE